MRTTRDVLSRVVGGYEILDTSDVKNDSEVADLEAKYDASLFKTIVFETRRNTLLVAVEYDKKVDLQKLATVSSISRKEIKIMDPSQVESRTGMKPGSVNPLVEIEDALVYIDKSIQSHSMVLCGTGVCNETLVISSSLFLKLSKGVVAELAKET